MEPTARESRFRGVRVLEVALHHDIAFEHDFAHGLAICRADRHGLWVHHGHALLQHIAHPLATI